MVSFRPNAIPSLDVTPVFFIFINVNHDVGFESSESIPISLGYILATLKARGWDGIILDDLRDRPLTLNSLEKYIVRFDPAVVGFTAYQSTMHRIRFLCRYIKSRHRRIKIILGGPQAVLMPSAALAELEDVDALVRQDGEVVMPAVARALIAGQPLQTVQGITCRCAGGIMDTDPGPEPPDDLDAYASPYLSNLLNLEGKDTAILISSRGCSHFCRFCITPGICKGRVRFHSVQRTLEEMELLEKRGIQRFWFADPNFTEDPERTEKLLAEKIGRRIAAPFWFQTRSDLVDPPLLAKLREAGADTVAFGLESGSPTILARTNKGIELERLRENITAALSLGLEAELFTIYGLPGETIEDARQTLDFVRSLGIPIHSNSGSQQMQLYFGSVYSRNPARFGFRPLPGYRPGYLSIGDEYETQSMTRAHFRKVRNMWALANEQIERDVYFKQRVFEILDFLLSNREDLAEEPAFHAYGALTSSTIEEFGLLHQFLEGYASLNGGGGIAVDELISSLSFFKDSNEPAGPMDRVIFDSRSWINGVPFTGISGKYWDVLLGRDLLLPAFEEGFLGARENDEISFSFVFPDDYSDEDLTGKEVKVQAKIRKVFKSVKAHTLEEVRNLASLNRYPFPDLDLLKDQNEILYYFALRDAEPETLVKTPSHFLMLVHKLAKLGKREQVSRLAGTLDGKPAALVALADTLTAAGKCAWADEYYSAVGSSQPSRVAKRAMCMLAMDEPSRALALLQTVPEEDSLEFRQALLECLKKAAPESKRIPSLSHHLLDLRVRAALDREAMSRLGTAALSPIVHGEPRRF
jgi:radical SAM superfamily enzyme YgiQ (UPF0313 family)